MDSFSVMWIGELKPHKTDEYLHIHYQTQWWCPADDWGSCSSLDGVNADTFYPRKVEYTHFTDEATVELLC